MPGARTCAQDLYAVWAAPWLALAYSRLRGRRGRKAVEAEEDQAGEADMARLLAREGGGEDGAKAPPPAQRPPASRRAMHLLVAVFPILLGTARYFAPKSSYPVMARPLCLDAPVDGAQAGK